MSNNILEVKQKFNNAIKDLKNEIENEVFYNNHVLMSKFHKLDQNNLYVLVENEFIKEVLSDYSNEFDESFSRHFNMTINTIFVTEEEKNTKIIKTKKFIEERKSYVTNLDKRLTFSNLVVGVFNENAVKAASMLIDNLGSWNSLFIYGGTGLGKTHLLNAIGNEFLKKNPEKNVFYLQTEDFYRNVYSAISKGGIEVENYKDSFKDIDLLLVDDIQFLNNKEKTNEIFFTIFNNLIRNNKYVVLSSDKIPNALAIEDRMISRFNSGLQIKINKPDLESVKRIIIMKVNESNRKNQFTKGAVEFLANRFNADVRVLEGLINKIVFHSVLSLNKEEIINEDKIREIIDQDTEFDYISKNISINPEIIIETICLAYNVDVKSILSKKRNQEYSFPRKVCMYVLRKKLDYSYNQIGTIFSNRNHSTVIESIKDVETKIEKDDDFSNFVEKLTSKL